MRLSQNRRRKYAREKDGTLDYVAEHCDFDDAHHTLTHAQKGREQQIRDREAQAQRQISSVIRYSAYSLFKFL